ncbi:VPLPA-CTERM protein sorting domain-containing protein [Poseidonocella pacifica]|uniref:VPLPA-CTERM protein sorting domain-containing protein n=1 Tax=Poseidonocella pacifica TaxID=871651 RepID=A0A1I0VTI6_9RHOB|nr:hypothetical protein [Poseidonocella pacifica]SFA79508.1 VPLPA-CTERM protein sorting domain-containing protein [Poseidonocella pacifica]
MRFWIPLFTSAMVAGPAFAVTYTYDFTAEYLDFTSGGTTATGTPTDDTVDSIADAAFAFKDTGISGTLKFSDVVLSTSGNQTFYEPIEIMLNEFSAATDIPFVSLRIFKDGAVESLAAIRSPTFPALSTNFSTIGMIWTNTTGTVFDDPDFLASLDIGDFGLKQLFFMNQRDDGPPHGGYASERVNFEITTLQLRPVPLPAGGVLLPLGLLGLAILRRRKASA